MQITTRGISCSIVESTPSSNQLSKVKKKVAATQTVANWRKLRTYLWEKYFEKGISYFVEFILVKPQ
jgi:hypothetical protein